jgi:hypothetical protein
MRRGLLPFIAAVSMAAASMVSAVQAAVVSFGSDANVFQMEFVTIGNPGNAPDTDPNASPISATLGSVAYTYGIGKFEVSRDMIMKFNASQSLQITLDDMTSYGGNGPNKPATGISWNEAARFVNWLNTSTGNQPAYKFTTNGANDNIALWDSGDAGYDSSNLFRNRLAKYVLPSYNEWYKAAYYSSSGTYYDFPNGRNTAPTPVASGDADNTAVHNGQPGPADVTQAGGLSPYGVMGLGGNVFEWEESSTDLANNVVYSSRGLRGGVWYFGSDDLASSKRHSVGVPSFEYFFNGFRVASVTPSSPPAVPEPSMMVIGTLFGLGGLVAKRRMRK